MVRRRKTKETVDLDFTLRRVFGKKSFRPLQREVIVAAIEGHDVFLQAATSFGKSLCFQLPAVVSSGITVAVSPLLALMKAQTNQIDAARASGIPTETISSNTPLSERKRIEADLRCGHPSTRLIYVTPELCATSNFRKLLVTIHNQGQLTRIAIDEAHCISEWGHDFRPAYKELQWFKQTLSLPSIPIIALTATATPHVREDIVTCLGLRRPTSTSDSTGGEGHGTAITIKFFSTTTARPNLHYEVRYFSESSPQHPGGDDRFPNLLSWLTALSNRRAARLSYLQRQTSPSTTTITPSDLLPITGIIYVPYRTTTESLSQRLTSHGISASAYHAGLAPHQRQYVQENFLHPPSPAPTPTSEGPPPSSSIDQTNPEFNKQPAFNIIIATTAFGMGIDCPHVRFVLHYGLPRGFEAFVQESGRAGRDGRAASCIVLYSREERDRILYRLTQDVCREANNGQYQKAKRMDKSNSNGSSKNNNVAAGHADSAARATSKAVQAEARMQSMQYLIRYFECASRCRHELIAEYFQAGDQVGSLGTSTLTTTTTSATTIAAQTRNDDSDNNTETKISCDYACDYCKEGKDRLRKRMERGLADEETALEFSQRERHQWGGCDGGGGGGGWEGYEDI